MHLTARSLVLLACAAVLAIATLWSGSAALRGLWAAPLGLLALGLALESAGRSQLALRVALQLPPRFYLGRDARVMLQIRHDAAAPLRLELLPRLPPCLAGDESPRRLTVPAAGSAQLPLSLTPVALGEFRWPTLPARLRGAFGLATWSCEFVVDAGGRVQPDLRVHRQLERSGWRAGRVAARVAGSGGDLQQLRDYRSGDPRSRIAWKASARHGRLLLREFSDEQQLDLLLVVDAGLRSRARAGRLDRFGTAINVAAGFAESAIARDDRVGVLVYAERTQAVAAPARGQAALLRVRSLLGAAQVASVESDPLAAALQARRLLRHRALIVWLTAIDDAAGVDELGAVLRWLTPPHLVVFGGVTDREVGALARRFAHDDDDVWIALAAAEHEERLAAGLLALRRRGAPVVSAPAERLEPAVLATYARLRERHRI